KVWPVLAPTTMHQRCFPGADHPPERTSAATRSGVSEHAGVRESTTAEKESGSPVCRAEESDRPAPLASAEIEVCAEQFYLAATVQNLKRLVRFLSSQPATKLVTA